jgi:hypothetical protein
MGALSACSGMLMLALALGAPGPLAGAAPQARAAISPLIPRFQGRASQLLEAAGTEVTVRSEPLALQVGHLYRLSGKIRARGVRVDPEARYPTALGACLSMVSFPFTNASPAVAADNEGTVSVLFFAATAQDRVQLHLGRNGRAWGTALFEDVKLEKVEDVTAYIPLETVRWSGKAFRYEDGGWSFVHLEGEPHARGLQYGELMSADIERFLDKLAVNADARNPVGAWAQMRTLADALFFRKYEVEYLEEMKGIAEGAARAGARFRGREIDLLDIVTANSAVDIDYLGAGLRVAANPLTGRTFTKAEDQSAVAPDRDKCSSLVATQSATTDGRPVMTQMFMWGGYTGVEWNVIVDVVPTKGHRLVYQTFPGGLHSGTDWYMNSAGMVIGETTVGQTPFNPEGTPQSNRIRKAAQYAGSIDEFAAIMTKDNNGLYTNEWTLADMKTGEGGDLLLGTNTFRLYRTGSPGHGADTPGDLKDFIWANNNNRDLAVRKEYVLNPDNAPVDLAFNTWNRDIAFWQFYQKFGKGQIDLEKGIRAMASSPINRPHACDGKITTGEMADQLMFMAHFGKTTQREKMVGGRYIPADLPNATPQLTLGYVTFSPIFVAERLQAVRDHKLQAGPKPAPRPELGDARDSFTFDKKLLWTGTVYPASDAENWFSSGSAAYHALLKRLPEDPSRAFEPLRDALADATARYLYFAAREGAQAPARTLTQYDRYGAYQLPRVKGTVLLHQLRLLLGNTTFARVMDAVQTRFNQKPMTNADFIRVASEVGGRDLSPFIRQWLDRNDLPDPKVTATAQKVGEGYEVQLRITQAGDPYHFLTTAEIRTAKGSRLERVEVRAGATTLTLPVKEKPTRVLFNATQDLPVPQREYATLANLSDDFDRLLFVWGSGRSVEAGRTLALNFRDQVADATTEVLPPLKSDAEVSAEDLASRDLVILGGPEDNPLLARIAREKGLPLTLGRNFFRFQGRAYGRSEDGLVLCLKNPYNPARTMYLFLANSRLQLWQMTRTFTRGIPGWALYRGAEITARGYHANEAYDLALE